MGGGTLVSTLIGGSIGAVPCEEEGIGIRFSSKADASYLDAGCLEVSRGGIYKCGTPC